MLFLGIFLVEVFLLSVTSSFLTKSLSQLFFRLTRNQTTTIQLLALLFLPGVVIHELAHFLTASLLFVPVGEIEFFPQVTDGGVKLGSVSIAKTDPFRRAIIGVAPVLVGISLLLFGMRYFLQFTKTSTSILLPGVILLYLLFEISNTMFSSKKDIEGLAETIGVILFFAIFFFLAKIQMPLFIVAFFQSAAFVSFFQSAALFMIVPLLLDSIIFLLIHTLLGNVSIRIFQ